MPADVRSKCRFYCPMHRVSGIARETSTIARWKPLHSQHYCMNYGGQTSGHISHFNY